MSSNPQRENSHTTAVSAAFDRKAAVYDAFGEDHPHLNQMRQRVYTAVTQHLTPNSHLLELNAGTGLDASQIVARGHRVHATDLAPEMIAAINAKVEAMGLHGRLTSQQCSFTQLDQVTGRYDGIYSNFGGLNCIPDLTTVTQYLPQLLKPNGVVVWVIMPPICPWELALFAKDWRVATRRLHRNGVTAHVEGVHFTTWYFSARQAILAFGDQFRCIGLEGLSVLTPTGDNKTFNRKYPHLYRGLHGLDQRLCRRWPFNGWGDFYILTMRYVPKT